MREIFGDSHTYLCQAKFAGHTVVIRGISIASFGVVWECQWIQPDQRFESPQPPSHLVIRTVPKGSQLALVLTG